MDKFISSYCLELIHVPRRQIHESGGMGALFNQEAAALPEAKSADSVWLVELLQPGEVKEA